MSAARIVGVGVVVAVAVTVAGCATALPAELVNARTAYARASNHRVEIVIKQP